MKKALLMAAVILSCQAANAQFTQYLKLPDRNPAVMSELMDAVTDAPSKDARNAGRHIGLLALRGGSGSKKPLGQYMTYPDMVFHSDYPNESAETMCQFAFDLHQFVKMRGADIEGLQKSGGHPYPFDQQAEFAKTWWSSHSPKYASLAPMFREWFVHDALVDATNIWNFVYLHVDKQGSADRTIIGDSMVQNLVQKKN